MQPLYPSQFHTAASNISLADFQCPSCMNILNRSIQLSLCGKTICMDCFVAHMKGGSGVCPGCSGHHEHGIDKVQSPSDVVVKLMGDCTSGVRARKIILWSLWLEDRYSTQFRCFLVITLNYKFCFSLKPLTLERITKGRITTEKACRKTVRQRYKGDE